MLLCVSYSEAIPFNLLQDECAVVSNTVSLAAEKCSEDRQLTLMSSIDISHSERNITSDDAQSDRSEPFQDSGSEYVPSNYSEQEECADREKISHEVVQASLRNEKLETPRSKKRTRSKIKFANSSNSERIKHKDKRMKGEGYVSFNRLKKENMYQKVQRGERKMGPTCKCKLSTTSKQFFCQAFTETERKAIFDYFWKHLTWGEKKVYIRGLVDIATPKCHRAGN